MPAWVDAGLAEYAKRMPPECALLLTEIEAAARPAGRGKAPAPALLARLRAEEAERLAKAVPAGARLVALDGRGAAWSTDDLARQLDGWLAGGRDVALLVGGPDGLDDGLLARAEQRWSLSPLTFPHPLVRVIVAEQLYRAWTILKGHPYHRGA